METLLQLENCHHKLDIQFQNLGYSISQRRGRKTTEHIILKGINGSFKSGRLTGILGASGAGKSTLLNVLSGFRTNGITGTIFVNGKERNVSQFRKSSCYIVQDSALLSYLTIEETLIFAADLKLGTKFEKARKRSLVDGILQILGLVKAKKTSVGKLSGGEQKRLSIGVELLTNPPVMFFDEPTSGLDSLSSLQVITYLKSLAEAGRTIICTIHQPSSHLFEMFDDIYLLSEGQCLYSGPIDDLTTVLEEEGFCCPKYYNRAEFAIEVACKERGNDIENLIKRNMRECVIPQNEITLDMIDTDNRLFVDTTIRIPKLENSNPDVDTELGIPESVNFKKLYKRRRPFHYQAYVLIKREFVCLYRNLALGLVRLLVHLASAVTFGILSYGKGNDAAFVHTHVAAVLLLVTFLLFVSPILTVLSFPMEAAVFYQEHKNNWYSLKAYVTAKLLSDIPFQIICTTLYMFVSYYLIEFPVDNMRPFKLWGLCIITAVFAQSLGFVLGAALSAQIALFILIALNIVMQLFSGFVIRTKDITVFLQWIQHISYFRMGFQGVMQILFNEREKLDCSDIFCYFRDSSKILRDFGMEEDTLEREFIGISVWTVFFQILFFLILKWKTARSY